MRGGFASIPRGRDDRECKPGDRTALIILSGASETVGRRRVSPDRGAALGPPSLSIYRSHVRKTSTRSTQPHQSAGPGDGPAMRGGLRPCFRAGVMIEGPNARRGPDPGTISEQRWRRSFALIPRGRDDRGLRPGPRRGSTPRNHAARPCSPSPRPG